MDESIPSDDRPTATLETLQLRARLLAATRRFFDEQGFFEVDTPLLGADRVIDPHIEPFAAVPAESARSGPPLYLQTSPEFAMKRLLCEGATAIYQLGKVFRSGERGARHNPEFTMLEWYRTGDDHFAAMRLTEALVRRLAKLGTTLPEWSAAPFSVTTYRDAFLRVAGFDPHVTDQEQIVRTGRQLCPSPPESLEASDRDGWLNLILAECIEPTLGFPAPEFLVDYPASQGALARLRTEPDGVRVAERFELYWNSVELCNGYHELTDADELRGRIVQETGRRAAEGLPPLTTESRLLRAMDRGLPPCAGNAVGFDRLFMLLSGTQSIADVIAFPTERA